MTAAGAKIVATAADAWGADMVMKVKEPLPSEYAFFRDGLVLYTYLHLAPLPELTGELMAKKVRAIAYETIQTEDGALPLLRPMSEVAGRLAVQVGASCLEKQHGGKGLLLGGERRITTAREQSDLCGRLSRICEAEPFSSPPPCSPSDPSPAARAPRCS